MGCVGGLIIGLVTEQLWCLSTHSVRCIDVVYYVLTVGGGAMWTDLTRLPPAAADPGYMRSRLRKRSLQPANFKFGFYIFSKKGRTQITCLTKKTHFWRVYKGIPFGLVLKANVTTWRFHYVTHIHHKVQEKVVICSFDAGLICLIFWCSFDAVWIFADAALMLF